MIRTWVEDVVEYAEHMTEEEFREFLKATDLTCEQCGTCCVIPDLPFLRKPPHEPCKFLTSDKKCSIHENKPFPCIEFPHMQRFDWVVGWKLAPPRVAVQFCGILRKFWLTVYKHIQEKK